VSLQNYNTLCKGIKIVSTVWTKTLQALIQNQFNVNVGGIKTIYTQQHRPIHIKKLKKKQKYREREPDKCTNRNIFDSDKGTRTETITKRSRLMSASIKTRVNVEPSESKRNKSGKNGKNAT